jgi:hypothetical protein
MSVTVDCPSEGCEEEYEVNIKGVNLSQELTSSCDGCGEEVRVSDNSIEPYQTSFNVCSETNTERYTGSREDEEFEKL